MDLGVTRMLTQRLVRVFPFMCNGVRPATGSMTAGRRVTNVRFQWLGRRSKASKAPPG